VDNYAFIKLTIVREAERERGGGCIIGVLEITSSHKDFKLYQTHSLCI